MANLYHDIPEQMQYFANLLAESKEEDFEGDRGEIEKLCLDMLESLQFDAERKFEYMAMMVKNYEVEAKTFEGAKKEVSAEQARLLKRQKVAENAAKSLKEYMKLCMYHLGIKKIAAGSFKLGIQANPKSLKIASKYEEDPSLLPDKYKKITYVIDKDAIKKDLDNGIVLDCIAHYEQTEGVRIR